MWSFFLQHTHKWYWNDIVSYKNDIWSVFYEFEVRFMFWAFIPAVVYAVSAYIDLSYDKTRLYCLQGAVFQRNFYSLAPGRCSCNL